MKIRPLGTKFFHADTRTDMTNLKVAFRNYATAPNKNESLLPIPVWEYINLRYPPLHVILMS